MMGSCVKRGYLSCDGNGKFQMAKTRREKVWMRKVGAEELVVVMKPGNSGGAKGFRVPVINTAQLNWE